MTVVLLLAKEAEKHLRKLDAAKRRQVLNCLRKARDHPLRYFGSLRGTPVYRMRCGAFRIFAMFDEREALLIVFSSRNRRNAYRRM